MNKKFGVGFVVSAIIVASMFLGCVEEEKAPAAYPTPTPELTESPTPTSTPTPPTHAASSVEGIKSNAVVISYDDLFRNNENHIGKIVYFRGNIVQMQEGDSNRYILRVATKNGYDDVIWVNYEGERLMEDDIIDVWGEVKGLRTYEAVLGNAVTVPEIDSLHVELVAKQVTTLTPKPTPAYSKGDVIGMDTLKYSDTGKFVYDYDEKNDEYRIVDIYRIYGIWVYTGSIFSWRSRDNVERDYPNKYETIDFAEVMNYDEYWNSEYRTWMDGYVLPIEEKDRESWYEILKFTGDKWDEGRTKSFAIKGDRWSIRATTSGPLSVHMVLYEEGVKNPIIKVLDFSAKTIQEFTYHGGKYHLTIEPRELPLPPEIRALNTEPSEWEVIIGEYY